MTLFRLLLALAACGAAAAPRLPAKELEGVYSPAAGPCPTIEEAIAKMAVPDGYAVRCFASEPLVINPVAMSWDARGRLWVVELYEYPSGAAQPNDYSKTATDSQFRPVIPQEKGSPRDRVVILEDTDNDGRADRRTVFAEGLSLATAIVCGHGGAFIGQAPNLFFFRDTDGDDRADEYQTLLTGFGLEDRHELLNSFTWGPDAALYLTHGVFTESKVRRPEQPVAEGFTLNAGVFRVRLNATPSGPQVQNYEVYADGTSNPWGVDFNARGNAFVEACVIDHFFHLAPGGLYSRQGGAPENPYAYALLPSIVGQDHPRHFRAAYAGIALYQGGVYPPDTHEHAFFGNIHDNAIHEEAMDPVGATFKARPVRDFLRANNGWFRPVSIQTGPDGFLWVMDWCDKYPCYQNAQANPTGVDREKGRIWRVCYEGNPAGQALAHQSRATSDLNLITLSPEALVATLQHPNSWMRRQARVLIAERANRLVDSPRNLPNQAPPDLAPLRSYAPERESWISLLNAALTSPASHLLEIYWTLLACDRGFFQTDPSAHPDPAIRSLAARMEGDAPDGTPSTGYPNGKPQNGELLLNPVLEKLASDPDPTVRDAVAQALRPASNLAPTTNRPYAPSPTTDADPSQIPHKFKLGELPPAILRNLALASATPADATLPFHIWMALEPHLAAAPTRYLPLLAEIAPAARPLSLSLVTKAARRLTDTRQPENLDLLLHFLDQLQSEPDLVAAALDGILKAQEAGPFLPAQTNPAAHFARWAQSPFPDLKNRAQRLATLWGDPTAVAALIAEAALPATPLPRRLELLDTLRKLRTPTTRQAVLDLLQASGPDDWLIPVLRAAAEVGSGDAFSTPVLRLWAAASPPLRIAAAQFLTGRAEWQQRLLAALEQPDPSTSVLIKPRDLPATTRRFFATNPDPALRAAAERLLGRWSDSTSETQALIAAKRKACIEGQPDLALGKALFTATCATCHKFHGGGMEVGPELLGSGRSNLDAILANVIDPNQIIGNGYQNYLITTKDGRTLAGRIIEDTPTQVTLLGIGGSREVVPTAAIAKKEDTGLSLMPMGFGSLPDDQFRSLIWYILAPPEEGPLTPEKKNALIKGAENESALSTPAPPPPRIDWESVSLWNPDWKVTAPEFEGTPKKLRDFAGRKNVLQLHPFPDHKTPAQLTRKFAVPREGQPTLHVDAAAKEGFDWDVALLVNGREVLRQPIQTVAKPWIHLQLDLSPWRGQTIDLQLQNHPSGWSWEFSYWSDLHISP